MSIDQIIRHQVLHVWCNSSWWLYDYWSNCTTPSGEYMIIDQKCSTTCNGCMTCLNCTIPGDKCIIYQSKIFDSKWWLFDY